MTRAVAVALVLTSAAVLAAEKGDFAQSDNLGMNMVTWNLSKGTNTTVGDAKVLSEFVGLHYYFAKDVRVGLNFQFSEQLAPDPATGGRFRTFALLPQIGWNVTGPLFVAAILTIAPRTAGGANLVLGVQALAGASFPVTERVRFSVALELPYNFFPDQTVGITAYAGISVSL